MAYASGMRLGFGGCEALSLAAKDSVCQTIAMLVVLAQYVWQRRVRPWMCECGVRGCVDASMRGWRSASCEVNAGSVPSIAVGRMVVAHSFIVTVAPMRNIDTSEFLVEKHVCISAQYFFDGAGTRRVSIVAVIPVEIGSPHERGVVASANGALVNDHAAELIGGTAI